MLAGVATAGIPWGAMAADQLKLPYIYVRPKPKEHGLGNQIEGYDIGEPGKNVVVIEDLVSTGKSSLLVIEVLKKAGFRIEGLVSIFNYGFAEARDSFEKANVTCLSLTDYDSLISLAIQQKIITSADQNTLLNWRSNPAGWKAKL